jgi:hypothetical protein
MRPSSASDAATSATRPFSASDAAAPATPFFILGCPRSGTTLLRFMLDAHPAIAVTPETHYVQTCLPASVRATAAGRVSASAALDAFVRGPALARMGIDEADLRAAVGDDVRDAWQPLRAAMQLHARRRGAALVGEKTPDHALHWRALANGFPDARFVFVERDPRAVASSWRRTSWNARTPVEIAERWRRHAMALRAARRALRERCVALRYEDLVRDPEAVLRSVCRLLGAAFDPCMLDFHERRGAHLRQQAGAEDAADEGRDNPLVHTPPDPRRADAWHDECPADVVRIVESVCSRTMKAAGYAPQTPIGARMAQGLPLWPALWRERARRRWRRRRGSSRRGGRSDQPSTF